jgi:hypothetical protein
VKTTRSILWVILTVLLFSAAANAETFVTSDEFAVRLPLGWAEAPPEALRDLEAAIGELSGGTNTQKFDHGYQLASARTWFQYPYILIQVNRGGRIPEGELTHLERIESELREGVQMAESSLDTIVSNSSQGQTLYDEKEHVLWSTLSADFQGVGRVRGLIALRLTEYGFVQVMGYATEDTFAEYSPVFREAVRDLVFAEQHQYQPSLTDHAPLLWGVNLGKVAIAGLAGVTLAGVVMLVRFAGSKWNRRKS